MTTPRVTVPVEPTEKMLKAGAAHMRVDALHTPKSIYRAMLSAAPAPEGGAVSPLVRRLAYGYAIMHQAICHMAGASGASGRWYYDKASEAFGRVSPIHAITETSNPPINGDYFSGLSAFLDALAAREEAPACEMCNGRGEVGGPTGQTPESFDYVTERCPDCGGTGKFEAPAEAGEDLVSAIDAFMPSAEVAFLWTKETPPADEVQRYRERYWAVKEALLRLRAQRPAREDAQPVYALEVVRDPTVEGAKRFVGVTHPVPDALRVAVAKLEKAKITDDPAEVFMLAMEALAALQAEQKGGA